MQTIEVAHAIPGRIRIKIEPLRGDEDLAHELTERLWELPGVQWVEANPTIGSVTLRYDADSRNWADQTLAPGLRTVFGAVELTDQSRELEPVRGGGGGGFHAGQVKEFFAGANRTVAAATGGTDMKILLPLALVVLGVHGFVSAEKLPGPRWYDLLWFGFGTFMMLNAAGVPPSRAAEEAAELASGA